LFREIIAGDYAANVWSGSVIRSRGAFITGPAAAVLIFAAAWLIFPATGHAEEKRLPEVGLRAGFSGLDLIGAQTEKYFQQYDAFVRFDLPWERYSESGWGYGTRFLVSAGVVSAAGDKEFVTTLVPRIVLGDKEERISLEAGGGIALLSGYKFGSQDLGGPFQFVWDIGLRLKIYRGLRLGYNFQHISDATIYGNGSRGYDINMVEIGYRF
jgi:hypothetical protein